MVGSENICLGTWQFANIDDRQAGELIMTAHDSAIHMFDTAHVYGNGRAEVIIGQICTPTDTVITKVPALDKTASLISTAYPLDEVAERLDLSTARLRRVPESVLLHNWNPLWENVSFEYVASIRALVLAQGVKRFGISLPNGYNGKLEASSEIELLDDIELPFNRDSPSLTAERVRQLAQRHRVLARSLLRHGRDVADIPSVLARASATGATSVVGASTPNQIREWVK